jgi:predicted PurR-regulated permease PerM
MLARQFTLEDVLFVTLLVFASLVFVWMVRDFLEAVFWAALLASVFQPLHRHLVVRLGGRASLSAVTVLLAIVVLVILPLFFVALAVTRESLTLYERVQHGEIDLKAPMQWSSQAWPILTDLLHRAGIEAARITDWLSSAAVTTSRFLAERALVIGQNAISTIVQFFLMLYLVFFFVRDGTVLLDRLVKVIPFGDRRERRLFRKFAEVARATLKGTVVVAIVQGSLGGIALALVGITGAVFWAVVMTVLSVLPAVGTSIVWMPAAVWLFATGSVGKSIALALMGIFIGFVDNLLRPVLVGRDTQMSDYLILLSTLGGIAAFGLSGFVIGPILAALCVAGWDMFSEDFGEGDPDEAPAGLSRGDPTSEGMD